MGKKELGKLSPFDIIEMNKRRCRNYEKRVEQYKVGGGGLVKERRKSESHGAGNFCSRAIPSYLMVVLHEVQRSYATVIRLLT